MACRRSGSRPTAAGSRSSAARPTRTWRSVRCRSRPAAGTADPAARLAPRRLRGPRPPRPPVRGRACARRAGPPGHARRLVGALLRLVARGRAAGAGRRHRGRRRRPRPAVAAPGLGERRRAGRAGALPGMCLTPAWSPDGAHVAFRGVAAEGAPEERGHRRLRRRCRRRRAAQPGRGPGHRPAGHVRLGPRGLATRRRRRADLGRDGAVLCPVNAGGTCRLWRFPLRGGTPGRSRPAAPLRYAAARPAGRPDGRRPGRARAPPPGPAAAPAHPGRRLARPARRPRAGGRGRARARRAVRTWILSPAGSAEQRLPTVLEIHGGPTGTHAPLPWLPAWALAAAGLRVLRPDPRGWRGTAAPGSRR